MDNSKEYLYEKIVIISEQKGKLVQEMSQIVIENDGLKKNIKELEEKIKVLESGFSLDLTIDLFDKIKEKLIAEKAIGDNKDVGK
jgi:cell division protein FtsB